MLAWLDERTGLVSAWRRFADHPVPGGPSMRHVLPAILVYLFLQQAVLGILLATYYSPSASDAWASTAYLNDQVAAGWFVRGMHYHGTSAMVLAIVAYLGQLALTGDFRRPRELAWICTLVLLLVTMALGVTGNVLPWDDQGYWGIQVELGIVEQTPGGAAIREVVQGGSQAGNLTLTHLYAIHAFVLPAVGALLLLGIVAIGRRAQRAEAVRMAEGAVAPRPVLAFFPGQALLDLVAMALVTAALVGVTMKTHGSELFAPADPTSTFQARPEWYFLPLFQLRMYFEGPLEPIATMVIPAALGGFLVLAPFVAGLKGRIGHMVVVAGLGLVAAGAGGLTAISIQHDADNESFIKAMEKAVADSERARRFAKEGVVPEGGPAVFYNDPEYKVKKLYEEHCHTCHSLDGFGGDEGPTFTDYASRAWLKELVRDPKAPKFFGKAKIDDMEKYPESDLPDDQLDAVVEYLVSVSGDESETIDDVLAKKGKELWDDELDCNTCHELKPGESGGGPNLSGHASAPWVARVIRDSAAEDLYGESAVMPKFQGKLTDEEIDLLAQFVASRRHVGAEAGDVEPAE
jgi:ubiquinol-cytochrome c reductase cytochrome b subunit